MPPASASAVFAVGIAGLVFLDREPGRRMSPGLWLPVIWMAIGASRNLSYWLGAQEAASNAQYLDGSPLDRLIFSGLLAAALAVLAARARQTQAVAAANAWVLVFFLYCALSAVWSDFPAVAFKRWTKAFGNVAMVAIILTDPDPRHALRRVLASVGFLLIPSSILLIKYYPELGRGYDRWTGAVSYHGVTEGKNLLGSDCLVFGIVALWRVLSITRDQGSRLRHYVAHGTVLAMALWLFRIVDSSTSIACFGLAAGVLILLRFHPVVRPVGVHAIVATFGIAGAIAFGYFDGLTYAVGALGRDPSLTGRKELWDEVLRLADHPWLGTGFESFFLGSRLEQLWARYWWHPNEAHNGYLELYLNLGWVGAGLFAMLVASGYRHVLGEFRRGAEAAPFRLAILIVALVYNFTEAAFKVMHPMWIVFLVSVMAAPREWAAATVPARVTALPGVVRQLYPARTLSSVRYSR